eukprot:31074-Pelagococcus_subviridis.AAC.9
MTLSGLGCRLQTCRGLASQRFDSSFSANSTTRRARVRAEALSIFLARARRASSTRHRASPSRADAREGDARATTARGRPIFSVVATPR